MLTWSEQESLANLIWVGFWRSESVEVLVVLVTKENANDIVVRCVTDKHDAGVANAGEDGITNSESSSAVQLLVDLFSTVAEYPTEQGRFGGKEGV